MFRNCKIVALIPARGGSQAIKNKNMIKLNNRPMISYTITAAKNSKLIDEIYLSSDDKKILRYATNQRINTIIRPKNISSNRSHSKDTVSHFIKKISKKVSKETIIVFLQPTSPLRNSKHIDDSIKKAVNSARSLVSVCEVDSNVLKSIRINTKNLVEPIFSENILTKRRQDLEKIYKLNGAIYIFTVKQFLKKNNFPISNSHPFIMDSASRLDIDSKSDLKFLRNLFNKKN